MMDYSDEVPQGSIDVSFLEEIDKGFLCAVNQKGCTKKSISSTCSKNYRLVPSTTSQQSIRKILTDFGSTGIQRNCCYRRLILILVFVATP
jgi:DNA-directed RNA polymerase subunit N (RpoN/RPB10)